MATLGNDLQDNSVLSPGTSLELPVLGSLHDIKQLLVPGAVTSDAALAKDIGVSPASVLFKDVELGQTYRAVLRIKNKGSKPQQIRASACSTREFTCNFPAADRMAPGLDLPCEIVFRVPTEYEGVSPSYSDSIVIKGEHGGQVTVPLRAYAPMPDVQYPETVSFGGVAVNRVSRKEITLKNVSATRDASVALSIRSALGAAGPCPFTVAPSRVMLGHVGSEDYPSAATAHVGFDAARLPTGTYRALLALEGPGLGAGRTIDLFAEVVEHSVVFMAADGSGSLGGTSGGHGLGDDDGSIAPGTLDFGTMFFGQKHSIRTMLVNNGPNPVSFSLFVGSAAKACLTGMDDADDAASEGGSGAALSEDALQREAADRDFRVSPMQGSIAPYSQVPVTLTYIPQDRRPAPLFRSQTGLIPAAPVANQRSLSRMVSSGMDLAAVRSASPPRSIVGKAKQQAPEDAYEEERKKAEYDASSDFGDDSATEASASKHSMQEAQGKEKRMPPSLVPRDSNRSPPRRSKLGMSATEIATVTSGPPPTSEAFSSLLALTIPELGTTASWSLNGAAVRPAAQVSVGHIELGTVPVNGRRDAVITLSSATELLPLKWHIAKSTNYFAEPDHGTLRPGQSVDVNVAYIPTRLGPANEVIPVVFCPGNGLAVHYKTVDPSITLRRGAKDARFLEAAADHEAILTIPVAVTAVAEAPAPPSLPGQMRVPGSAAMTQAAIGMGLASQPGAPGTIAPHGGIVDGGVSIHLGGSSQTAGVGPLGTTAAGPALAEGSVEAPFTTTLGHTQPSVVSAFDGPSSVTGTGAIAALSNATGPNAMSTIFRRTERLAARTADMPLDSILPERVHTDQRPQEHTMAVALGVGGNALVATDTSAVELAIERDGTQLRGTRKPLPHADPWQQVATQRGLRPTDYPTDPRFTFNVSQLQAKVAHTAYYNTYVSTSAASRREAKDMAHKKKAGLLPDPADPVSLGIEHGAAMLREPKLYVPAANEPLWLERPFDEDGRPIARAAGAKGATSFNPEKLVKQKFKPAPTTQPERIDCSTELSEDELLRIECGPARLEMGSVNAGRAVTKSFGIYNGHTNTILVELQIPHDVVELATSSPLSQVIPSGATAGFDITFLAESEADIRASVGWVINGKHVQRFIVYAQAVPVQLQMVPEEVFLKFDEENVSPFCSADVRLTNPGDAEAVWRFEQRDKDAPFEIEPADGKLLPGESTTVTVNYRPTHKCRLESAFALVVKGGPAPAQRPQLLVSGESIDAKASTTERAIDFGRLGVGVTHTVTFSVKNSGTTPSVITVDEELPPHVTVEPMVARLEPLESTEMRLTLHATEPFVLDPTQTGVTLNMRGGKSVYMPTSAIVILPDVVVDVTPPVSDTAVNFVPTDAKGSTGGIIDFGRVTLGNLARRTLYLENRSPISTELTLDLSSIPHFSIRPVRNAGGEEGAWDEGIFRIDSGDDDDALPPESRKDKRTEGGSGSIAERPSAMLSRASGSVSRVSGGGSMRGVSEAGPSQHLSAINNGIQAALPEGFDADNLSDKDDEEAEEEEEEVEVVGEDGVALRRMPKPVGPRKLRIKLEADSTAAFDLCFAPSDMEPHNLSLPLTISNVAYGTVAGLVRTVTAVGTNPRIRVEKTQIDFTTRTLQPDPARRVPYTETFKIYNADHQPVTWRADLSAIRALLGPGADPSARQQVFTFSPESGTLAVDSSIELTVTFNPAAVRQYNSHVGLFLEDDVSVSFDGRPQPYLNLELAGEGVPPQLSFDRAQLVLPPVPLGGTAEATFFLHNTGFDHVDVGFRVPSNDISSSIGIPLAITFPEGSVLSISKEKIPVKIEFKSDKAMAFTTHVEFFDKRTDGYVSTSQPAPPPAAAASTASGSTAPVDRAVYAIPVTGCADSSLLTAYPFIAEHVAAASPLYVEVRQDTAPILVGGARRTDEPTGRHGHAHGGAGAGAGRPPAQPKSAAWPSKSTLAKASKAADAPAEPTPLPPAVAPDRKFFVPYVPHAHVTGLVKWLNTCLLRSPITRWPGDVVAQHGRPIYEALEALTGRPVQGRIKAGKLPTNKKARTIALHKQASDLLLFLKQHGALLHHLRPECLLSLGDFLYVRRNAKTKMFGPTFDAEVLSLRTPDVFAAYMRKAERAYPALSLDAWSTVAFQVIRLFVLSRVTLRSMIGLGGMYMDAESRALWDALCAKDAEVAARVRAVKASQGPEAAAPKGATKRGATSSGGAGAAAAAGKGDTAADAPAPSAMVMTSVLQPPTGAAPAAPAPAAPRPGAAPGAAAPGTATAGMNTAGLEAELATELTTIKRQLYEFGLPDSHLTGSNIYSTAEVLLLRWLSYHHNRVNINNKRRVLDWSTDLADGTVFLYTLLSHVPDLGMSGATLDLNSGRVHSSAPGLKEQRDNATAVVDALKQLGLEPPFTAEDLAPDAFACEDAEDAAVGGGEGAAAALQIMGLQGALHNATGADAAARKGGSSAARTKGASRSGSQLSAGSSKKDDGTVSSEVASVGDRRRVIRPPQPLFESGGSLAAALPGTNRSKVGSVNARDMLLWTLWLFQNLPQQVPKAVVDFKCTLGATATKTIVLTNPTNKPLVYQVLLSGAREFSVKQSSVKIEPGSSVSFPVECKPRFSRPSHAKLTFRSHREGTVAASVLVFALRSLVVHRPPVSVKVLQGPIYKPQSLEIEVKNTGHSEAAFAITVLQLAPDAPQGANVPADLLSSTMASNPSLYVIGEDGSLPIYLQPGYGAVSTEQASPSAASASGASQDSSHDATPTHAGETGSLRVGSMGGGSTIDTGSISSTGAAQSVAAGPGGLTAAQAAAVGRTSAGGINTAAALPSAGPLKQPDSIWCKYREVQLKGGQSKRLPLQFFPFIVGKHRAAVVLVDKAFVVSEMVFEVTATADPPAALPPKLVCRADMARTVERLLRVPPLNAHREQAADATLDRLDRKTRPQEIALREKDREADMALRERTAASLRQKKMTEDRVSTAAAAERTALKSAASSIFGTMFDVSVDSPFFELPTKRVFVPFPAMILPATNAVSGGKAADGSGDDAASGSASPPRGGNGSNSPSKAKKSNTAAAEAAAAAPAAPPVPPMNLPQLFQPALELPPGPLTAGPTAASIAAAPPSQFESVLGPNAATPFRPISGAAAAVDAILGGVEHQMRLLQRVPLVCRPPKPGVYPARVTLTSERDVRVFEVEFTVDAPSPARSITMTCPVGKPVTQQVPVVNASSRDWQLLVSINHHRSGEPHHFSAPDTLRVRAASTAYLTLTFNPEWVCDEAVRLTLRHAGATGGGAGGGGGGGGGSGSSSVDVDGPITFELRGVGEEPLALDNVAVSCDVREAITTTVTVFNHSPAPMTYTATCDLPHTECPPAVTVPPARLVSDGNGGRTLVPSSAPFSFNFKPLVAGTYLGSLTFADPQTGRYQWYSLELVAKGVAPTQVIPITAQVRTAVAVEIELTNPAPADSGHEVRLEVSLEGHDLIGEPLFILPPGRTATYEVLYHPFFPTPGHDAEPPIPADGLVTFSSEETGQITYALQLVALPAPPSVLPPVRVPVGSSGATQVTLENPTAAPAEVRAVISNGRNFSIEPVAEAPAHGGAAAAASIVEQPPLYGPTGGILIPAFSSRSIAILYTPSSLSRPESCTVRLQSGTLGEWVYELTGLGVAPEPAPPQLVTALAGSTVSATVDFRNPFDHPLPIAVDCEVKSGMPSLDAVARGEARGGDSSVPVVTLLKRTGMTLPPFGATAIPFTFTPSAINEVGAAVNIAGRMPDGSALRWVFPLRLIGEAPLAKKAIHVSTPARSTATYPLALPLPGLVLQAGGSPPRAAPGGGKGKPVPALEQSQFTWELVTLSGRINGAEAALSGLSTSSTLSLPATASMSTMSASVSQSLTSKSGSRSIASTSVAGGGGGGRKAAPDAALVRLKELVAKSVTIVPRRTRLAKVDEPLELDIQLQPLKPLEAKCELIISRSSGGGRWRFPLRLSVPSAAPDDVIRIEAPMGESRTVRFELANAFPVPAPFVAAFTLDSAGEFRVTPSQGVLPPSNASLYARGTGMSRAVATTFSIDFTAREYGKTYQGKLLIETDDMLWVFNVVGTLPSYRAPEGSPSKIEDRLDPRVSAVMRAAHSAARRRDVVSMVASMPAAANLGNAIAKTAMMQVGMGIGGAATSAAAMAALPPGAARSPGAAVTSSMAAATAAMARPARRSSLGGGGLDVVEAAEAAVRYAQAQEQQRQPPMSPIRTRDY